jgi:uncharacterized protein (TIGR02996 family)
MISDAILDELFAAVHAAPQDDEPRTVLADALQQRGDPRGEFIALQLQRRDVDRQRELIAAHGQAWIGRLAQFVMPGRRRFGRGFLVAGVAQLQPEQLDEAASLHEWASLERIWFSTHLPDRNPSVISSHMRSARALIDVCEAGVETLCRRHPELGVEELGVGSTRYSNYQPTRAIAALAACEGLDRLHTLHLEFGDLMFAPRVFEPLWASRVGQRLDTLVINEAHAKGLLDWRPPVRRLVVRSLPHWEMVEPATRRCFCRGPYIPTMWLCDARERGYTRALVELTERDPAHELDMYRRYTTAELQFEDLEVRRVAKDDPLPWEIVPEGV